MMWVRPDTTQAQYEIDAARCQYEAASSTATYGSSMPVPRSTGAAIGQGIGLGIGEGMKRAELIGLCLRAQGYSQRPVGAAYVPTTTAGPTYTYTESGRPIPMNYPANQAAFPTGAVPRSTPPDERVIGSATTTTVIGGESKYMHNAERVAKAGGCVAPASAMSAKGPGSEVFSVTCASGQIIIVRCDYNDCRLLTGLPP